MRIGVPCMQLQNSLFLRLFSLCGGPSQGDVHELVAVGKHKLIDNPYRCASSGCKYVNSDYVPRLYDIPGPTKRSKRSRTARFACPMHDVSVVALDVECEDIMGIRPEEFRHGCVLQDHHFAHIVRNMSVMCEQRT